MDRLVSLHDREIIGAFLRRNAPLHLYALGDLDDFFWPSTLWYGLERDGELRQLILGYLAETLMVVHALIDGPIGELCELLTRVRPLLPPQVYAHLSPGASEALAAHYDRESHGLYDKMLLQAPERLAGTEASDVERLSASNLPELQALYAASYPGNWFDPRMLETGHYYGLREEGELVSVAGLAAAARGHPGQHCHPPSGAREGLREPGDRTPLPRVAGNRRSDRVKRAGRQRRGDRLLPSARLRAERQLRAAEDVWSAVPTAGAMLAALTEGAIDGDEYDRALPDRQRSTLS